MNIVYPIVEFSITYFFHQILAMISSIFFITQSPQNFQLNNLIFWIICVILFFALVIFYISTRLTLIGFGSGELEKLENAIREHPEVIEAKAELDEIIDRQGEYGITYNEKMSLITFTWPPIAT